MAATLEEVSQELQESNTELSVIESNTDLTIDRLDLIADIFSTKMDQLVGFMRGQRLDDLERRREQSMATAAPSARGGGREDTEEKGLLGKGFENLTGGLIADAKALLAPIMSIAGMIVKGGVLALIVGGLYMLFKTIKDNPVFLETVESIKNIWENDIVPTFNEIRKSVMDFIESPAFDRILEVMDTLRTAFQTLFLRQLETVVDTLSNVFDGLADVITGILEFDLGKIYTGLNKVIGSIISAIVSTIDNIITAVLEVFGVSFEGDATLFEAITRGVKNIFTSIRDSIVSVFSGVKNWIMKQFGFDEGQMPSILDVVTGLYTLPYDLVKSIVGWIAGKLGFEQAEEFLGSFSFSDILKSIVMAPFNLLNKAKDWLLNKFSLDPEEMPDPLDIITEIIKAPFNLLSDLRDWISERVSGLVSKFARFIPGPLKSLLGLNDEDEEGEQSRGMGGMALDAAGSVGGAVSDTASGVARGVGGFVSGLFGEDDTEEVSSGSTPARVATGNELQIEGEARRDAELERTSGGGSETGQGNVNVSTNVQNNSNTTTQTRPPAASQPDNMSDTMMTVGFAP